MQIRRLVTVLGICLSQVHAFSFAESDGTIQSIVKLVTAPHEVLETSAPGLEAAEKTSLRESPYLYSHQLSAGLDETMNSLLYVGKGLDGEHTSLIKGSLLGYYHTIVDDLPEGVKEKRLQIYRDSLYSRIRDLAQQLGTERWNENGHAASLNLAIELQKVVLEYRKVRVALTGEAETISKIQNLAQKFKHDHKDLVEKFSQMAEHMKTHLPYKYNLGSMKYLDVDEVEAALEQTNVAGHTKALGADFLTHEQPAPEKIQAARTHHTTPAQLTASSSQVAAST